MKNYYSILGLAANGLNASGNKYSLDEIKTAYKKLVIKYHPDKNPEAQTRSKFEEIQKAYEIFEDPEKRKNFDEELSKAPGAVYDDEALILTLDDEVNIRLDQNDGISFNDGRELILAPPKGTDITILIENAEYSGEQILEIAKKKMSFAKAIVDNARSFSYLSGIQQFELLFIICKDLTEADVKTFLAKDSVKLLLNKLISHQGNFETDFLTACVKHKDIAIQGFKYLSEYINKFSKKFLYALGQCFPEFIEIIMQKHASDLRISEVISLLDKNNGSQQKIVDAYMQTASETQRDKLQNYLDMTRLLADCKDWQQVMNIMHDQEKNIGKLGIDAFQVVNFCQKKFKEDKDKRKNEDVSEINNVSFEALMDSFNIGVARYFILKIIFSSPTNIDLANLQKNDKSELCSEILSALLLFQEIRQLDYDESLVDFLLNNISIDEFGLLISRIKLDAFDDDTSNKIILHILNYSHNNSPNDRDDLNFWGMLNKLQSSAWKCLLKNKKLLLAIFKYPLFMTLSDDVKKRMMYACSYFQLSEDQIPFAKLSLSCLDIFKAYNEFFTYINRKDLAKTGLKSIMSGVLPAISKEPIDYEIFKRLFEITGYFEDLSDLKMHDDFRIYFELLRGSLAEQSQQNDIDISKKYQYKRWIESILSSGDLKIIGEMLNLIGDNYDDLIYEMFQEILKINYSFKDILLRCANLYTYKNWFIRNIYGATLYALMQAVYSYKGVKKILSDSYIYFDYKDSSILNISDLKKELKNSPDQYRQILIKFAANLKQQNLKGTVLQARLINIITLIESEEIIKKADSYGMLLQKLEHIKSAPGNEVNNDIILQDLLNLLAVVGIDKQTFKLLRASVGKHFYLWSAMLLLIRESKTLVIFRDVEKKLNNNQQSEEDNNPRQAKPLELMFLTIAKHHLSKYRSAVSGDKLIEMVKIFGNDIVADINLYGLEDKFIQARKLDKIFSNIQQKTASFENQKFNADQVAEALLLEFELLVNNASLHELTIQPNAEKYFNDLCPFMSRLDKERLTLIHKNYPKEYRQNLLLWVLNCAFAYEHFSKSKLIDWINHQDSFLIITKSLMEYITDLISNNKITVNALRDLLGQLTLTKLITAMLLDENVDNPLIKSVLMEIDQEELTSDEIKQRFGDVNRDRLLTIFFQTINIFKKRRLIVSMIHATLAGDEFCKAYLIKWCEEKDRLAELIYFIFETITKYIKCQQTISLEEIKKCFGDFIFYKVVTAAFSQGDYHLQPLVTKILDIIDQQNFDFVEIDQLCGDYNRKLILDSYLKKYSINNKHKLILAFIEHGFKQEDYSCQRLKAWLNDPLIGAYVISSIANYLSDAACIIDISVVRNISFNMAIPKIISLILKQANPFDNRIIKQISNEINQGDLTVEEIEQRYGIDNKSQLLEGYIKSYSIIEKERLFSSFLQKAFVCEHFSRDKLLEWINDKNCLPTLTSSIMDYTNSEIENNKLSINVIRNVLGENAYVKLIALVLKQENAQSKPFIKAILTEIGDHEMVLDEIKQQYGDLNRNQLLSHFFEGNDILKKRRLLESIILATLINDQFCKEYLIKWCQEDDKSAASVHIIFEIITIQLQHEQIKLEEIKNYLNESILYSVISAAFSQDNCHTQSIVKVITSNIDHNDFTFAEVDLLYGATNRNRILDTFLQKYSIINKNKLVRSFIEHGFKQDDYACQRLKSWLEDSLIGTYVISSIANYLSDAACSIDISVVRNISFNTAIPKIISLILKQVSSFDNRIIKQIINEIDQEDLTIEEIEKRYGIDNKNRLLEGYFKSYSIIGKNQLLSSLIRKAFADDKLALNKMTELCSVDDIIDKIVATITAVLSDELSNGKNILDLIGCFNLIARQKIFAYILDQNNEISNIFLGKIILQIDFYNLSFTDVESYFGKTNINKILHHHFKAKNSLFAWPMVQEEINRNSICRCILQGHLPLAQLFRLEKNQLDRLGNNIIVKYLNSKPVDQNLFLLKILDDRQDKFILMPLVHEGLIDNEFDAIDYDTVAFEAYQYLIEQADWNNKAQIKLQLLQLNNLLSKSIYTQIDKYIIELIDIEIKRLKEDIGSSFKESGEIKAKQLEVAKNEIKAIVRQDIMHHVKNHIAKNIVLPVNHVRNLAEDVKNKMFEISRRDVIANSRNKIAAFSKGVFGVFLSLPLFCVPLFVEKYRDFFFKSDTASSLKYFSETTRNNGSGHNLGMRNQTQ